MSYSAANTNPPYNIRRKEISQSDFDLLVEQLKLYQASDGKTNVKPTFAGLILKNIKADKVNFFDSDFRFCDFSGSEFNDCYFRNSSLDWSLVHNAFFPHCDFRYCSMRGVEGTEASFWRCKFKGAELWAARLTECNFEQADFSTDIPDDGSDVPAQGEPYTLFKTPRGIANLTGADLRSSLLYGTDLSGVMGLEAASIAKSALTDAKLPENISKFDGLSQATEASKSAQIVFFATLTICAATIMVAWSGMDQKTNPTLFGISTSRLTFKIIAPIFASISFVYMHFILFRLWMALAFLPTIFQDGLSIKEKIAPLVINNFVLTNRRVETFSIRREEQLYQYVAIFLAWIIIPVALFIQSWGFLDGSSSKGELIVSFGVSSIALAISILTAFFAYRTQKSNAPFKVYKRDMFMARDIGSLKIVDYIYKNNKTLIDKASKTPDV